MTCLHSSSASPLTLYSRQTISFDGALYLATYIDTTVSIYTLICCILCRKLASYDDGLQRTRKKKEDCEMRPHSGNIAAQFRKLRLVLLLRSLSSLGTRGPFIIAVYSLLPRRSFIHSHNHSLTHSFSQPFCPWSPTKGVIASSRTRVNSHLPSLFVRRLLLASTPSTVTDDDYTYYRRERR